MAVVVPFHDVATSGVVLIVGNFGFIVVHVLLSNLIGTRPGSLVQFVFVALLKGITDVDEQLPIFVEGLVPVCRIFVRNRWSILLDHQLRLRFDQNVPGIKR